MRYTVNKAILFEDIKIDNENKEYKELKLFSNEDVWLETIPVYNFNDENYNELSTLSEMGVVFGVSEWIID
jgi:hypothetical protein